MKLLLVLSAAVAALAVASSAFASPTRSAADVVIAKTAGGVLVANAEGGVTFVHSNARVGTRVVKIGARLWIVGHARSARFRGIVVATRGNMLVLSAAHRLFMVGLAGRKLADDSPGGPRAGDVVGVVASIDANGDITATSTEDDGPAGTSQVQATIASVGTDTITLDVNGETLTLQLPAGATVPATSVGQQVTLTITFAGDQANATEDGQGEDQSGDDSSSPGGSEDGGDGGGGGDG